MRSATSHPAPAVRSARSGSALDPRTLAQLRLMLEQQRGFRLEQLAELARPAGPGQLLGGHDDEITAALAAGARAALRDVTEALARMADGTYGRCTHCASPLAIERLEILPQVALCTTCQRAEAVRGGAG